MNKKIIYLLCMALLVGLAGNAVAQTWDEGRHLNDPCYVTDHLWVTPENWSMGVCPSKTATNDSQWAHMADPNAHLCIIRCGDVASAKGTSSGTYGNWGTMKIYGTMDATWLDAGRGGGSAGGYDTESVGYILIDRDPCGCDADPVVNLLDGGLTIPSHFDDPPIARGTVEMNRGTINPVWLSMGLNNGIGEFYLNGGTVNMTGSLDFNLAWGGCDDPTLNENESFIDIDEGVIIMDNDHTAGIQGYIDKGWITFYGGLPQDERFYILDYDITTSGKTTIAGIDPCDVILENSWHPVPEDRAMVDITDSNIMLDWRSGDPVGTYKHDVYFGTTNPPAYVTQTNETVTEYGVTAGQLDTAYYWKIDEVSEPNLWPGPVWSFTTADYLTVDDFDANDLDVHWTDSGDAESSLINDNSTMRITCGANKNGSVYREPPQSDWDQQGLMAMRLSFFGNSGNNAGAQLSVTVNSTTVVYDNAESLLQSPEWTQWYIPYSVLTGLGANLNNVTRVWINVSSGASDLQLDIDNIELTLLQCIDAPAGDASGDCEVDLLDVAALANEWLVSGYELP